MAEPTTELLEVRCGYFALGRSVHLGLEGARLSRPLVLIVDAPFGFAMDEMNRVERKNAVIVSDSPCPEYWDEVWRMQPHALLVRGTLLPEIQKALEQASRGQSFRRTPKAQSQLSVKECSVLRLCAQGKKNPEIARTLHLSERSVANMVSKCLRVLSLESRSELPLYFFGCWSYLEAYRTKVDRYNSSLDTFPAESDSVTKMSDKSPENE